MEFINKTVFVIFFRMFLFWPWIGLLATCVLIIAILTIRFAGRVNLRPLDQRVKHDQVLVCVPHVLFLSFTPNFFLFPASVGLGGL